MSQWTVEVYPEGEEIGTVYGYLLNLPAKEQAQLYQIIKMLQELGPDIQHTKMDKLIDGSFRELRKNRHRILYCRQGRKFILLVAFRKDSQKTPIKNIECKIRGKAHSESGVRRTRIPGHAAQ